VLWEQDVTGSNPAAPTNKSGFLSALLYECDKLWEYCDNYYLPIYSIPELQLISSSIHTRGSLTTLGMPVK